MMVLFNACEKTDTDVPTADRDQFIGTYASESTGPGGPRNFSMTITASSSAPDQIKMQNFDGGNNATIFASVSGINLTISNQSVSGETYDGTGSLSGKKITINFSVF